MINTPPPTWLLSLILPVIGFVIGVWTKLRALGFSLKSRLYSPEVQAIDEFLVQVPNFIGGSDHVAINQVRLGGAGMDVYGAFSAESANIIIPAGKALMLTGTGAISAGVSSTITVNGSATWNSGALWRLRDGAIGQVDAGATVTVLGAFGNPGTIAMGLWSLLTFDNHAGANFTSGSGLVGTSTTWSFTSSTVNVLDACTWTFSSSGTPTILNIADRATINVNGSASATGQLVVGRYGIMTVSPGGTVNISGTTALPTIVSMAGDGTLGTKCTLSLSSACGLALDSTCPASLLGNVTLGHSGSTISQIGDTTRTGSATRSGAGAFEILRLVTGPSVDGTIDGVASDVTVTATGLGSDITYTMADPSPTTRKVRHSFLQKSSTQGGDIAVVRSTGSGLFTFKNSPGDPAAGAVIVWDGSGWLRESCTPPMQTLVGNGTSISIP